MTHAYPRLRIALHASLLALVVLGMLLRPALDVAAELLLAEHAIASHQVHHAPLGASAQTSCQQDHSLEGAHGLIHQEGSAGAWADLSMELSLPLVSFDCVFGITAEAIRVPSRHLAVPFRPPIA